MFGLFHKKPEPKAPAVRVSFVEQLIDAVKALPNANERLIETTKLKLSLQELQDRYSVDCIELGFFEDDLPEAFDAATSPKVMLRCATELGYREVDGYVFEKDPRFVELEEHLQARLIRMWVNLSLDELRTHPSEYLIENQAIFFDLEERGLSELEKAVELREKFGIHDWKGIREMNPDVFFTPKFL